MPKTTEKPPVQLDLELCEKTPCWRFTDKKYAKWHKCSNCPWVKKS